MDMKKVVTIPYDPVWEPLEWAIKHCPSYVTNAATSTAHHDATTGRLVFTRHNINYYFGDEKDAIIFKLKWS
jgi:hypothetical protein